MSKISKPIIVGNWKATPKDLKTAITFVKALDSKLTKNKIKKNYLLAVPDIYINSLSEITKHGLIGAENLTGKEEGQTTGLNTPSMLTSVGASFIILGHSEVRKRGETNESIKEKLVITLSKNIKTILCVGEEKRDTSTDYLKFVEEELKECLDLSKKEDFKNLIIAYEPVWAIGGSSPATTSECFEMVIAIRRTLVEIIGIDNAKKVSILYGGTVTKENAKDFIIDASVDGLLIGRASQNVDDFYSIIKSCI